MNNDLMNEFMAMLDSWSDDDLYRQMVDFGIDCERKVSVMSDMDIESILKLPQDFPATSISFGTPELLMAYAANDNSYALAA